MILLQKKNVLFKSHSLQKWPYDLIQFSQWYENYFASSDTNVSENR